MDSSVLEAMRIIENSWPLAFIMIALFGSIAIAAIVISTNRGATQRARIDSHRAVEIERTKLIGTAEEGHVVRTPAVRERGRGSRQRDEEYNG